MDIDNLVDSILRRDELKSMVKFSSREQLEQAWDQVKPAWFDEGMEVSLCKFSKHKAVKFGWSAGFGLEAVCKNKLKAHQRILAKSNASVFKSNYIHDRDDGLWHYFVYYTNSPSEQQPA